MLLRSHRYGPDANLCYFVADPEARSALVIDPPKEVSSILAFARSDGVDIQYVLNTHGHGDHTGGNHGVAMATGARVAAHRSSRIPKDVALEDGATLALGGLRVHVLHTPGHTEDSVCFLIEDNLFTGDTLFVGECGRTDLPSGDAGALYDSLFGRVLGLPGTTRIYPGHDYGPRPSSTLDEELRTSYVLRPRSREDFLAFMAEP